MPAIDHATIAGADLASLEGLAAELGFEPVYGGAHAHGGTEMSIVVFPDGSYLELLAAREGEGKGGAEPPRWGRHLRAEASPCAWALPAADIDATARDAAANGVEVEGPADGGRQRPDGTAVRWRFAFLGPGDPGNALPFLIDDETPREFRVPTDTVTEAVGGLAMVLVCVEDVEPVLDRFERALGASVDRAFCDPTLEATVHLLDGVPGALLVPESGPLSDRLDRYGDCVCGFLFEPGTGVPAARVGASEWDGTTVEWVGPEGTPPGRFGLLV